MSDDSYLDDLLQNFDDLVDVENEVFYFDTLKDSNPCSAK
jgi:hypothetical protein